ncbi:uncharacterized protein [Ptychodera flava]|uniref:uncharacterized protein n=1 Tax=Ptychodera flava TaxID=63121 RepID=UPI003969DCFC
MAQNSSDLRDLICVSRLTIRDSDEELSDNDEYGLPTSFDSLSLEGRPGTAANYFSRSESGYSSPNGAVFQPRPPSSSSSRHRSSASRPQPKSSRPGGSTSANDFSVVGTQPLPKLALPLMREPLPPVGSGSSRPSSSSSSNSDLPAKVSDQPLLTKLGNFDPMLEYLDTDSIAIWLKRATEMVSELSMWCRTEDNFVQFAHFWLKDFADVQKDEIFQLEVSIIFDEFTVAFSKGVRANKVQRSDLNRLLGAVFREYPAKLRSSKGSHIFLNILDTLSSERKDEYKKLLSDVKISTRNKDFAQYMLATRSFVLLNVWYAVVNFYRNVKSGGAVGGDVASTTKDASNQESTVECRAFQAAQHGYAEVLFYLMKCKKLDPKVTDAHGRTLIFTSVMHNQPIVLSFLLTKVQVKADVNLAADTGNTALHAAANLGYANMVKILCLRGRADVNVTNPQCDNATPLHLSVMHGHREVCEVLVHAGADVNAKMGDLTPLQLARDMDQQEILQIFSTHGGAVQPEGMES